MQTGAAFDPGLLTPLKTYYWRIDEVGLTAAVTTGDVWQFTTTLRTSDSMATKTSIRVISASSSNAFQRRSSLYGRTRRPI